MDLNELVVAARTDPAMAERLVETIRHDVRWFLETRLGRTGGELDDLVLSSVVVIYRQLAERDVSELGDSDNIVRWCRVVAANMAKDDLVARYRASRGLGVRKPVLAGLARRPELEQRLRPAAPAARARLRSRLAARIRGWASRVATRIRSVTSSTWPGSG